jgi:hypothetical protein
MPYCQKLIYPTPIYQNHIDSYKFENYKLVLIFPTLYFYEKKEVVWKSSAVQKSKKQINSLNYKAQKSPIYHNPFLSRYV